MGFDAEIAVRVRSVIDTVSPQHMLTSDSDGWFPIASGFSALVPKVVRGWAPVLAILDSTKLLHLGSTVQDDLLLAEGRKRFLLTMSCLRSNLKREPGMALPGLMIVSLGVSLCEVSVLQLPPRDRRAGCSQHRHAVLEKTNSLKVYSAISCEATAVSWQKQVIGMSALLLGQRPIDRASKLETFMIARLRAAQVGHYLSFASDRLVC
jgi:hypothetical protein